MTMPVLENAVETLFSKDFHLLRALNATDLGCATSPNTFTVISTIKRMMEKKCRELNCQTLELQVYLNDLPGNDFNTIFNGLSSKVVVGNKCKEVSCCVMGVPGSFHGWLFPRNSLHLVHSCYSAH
ncbi:putative caffeine synthase 2 [Camellia lanceoleosa]|uniref:Caffeine synthase 2 n=1 Tax=Camellia lanceoleosa TaxID=1840588 RepID=A0ACC0GK35_9ERIC|nr:putative caffeine synthase 2 [Camellia lanceoleosa]